MQLPLVALVATCAGLSLGSFYHLTLLQGSLLIVAALFSFLGFLLLYVHFIMIIIPFVQTTHFARPGGIRRMNHRIHEVIRNNGFIGMFADLIGFHNLFGADDEVFACS